MAYAGTEISRDSSDAQRGRAFMPSADSDAATPGDREEVIASVETLISSYEAFAAALELVGHVNEALWQKRLIAELREMLASMRGAPPE